MRTVVVFRNRRDINGREKRGRDRGDSMLIRELVGKSVGLDPDGPARRYLLIFIAARNVYGLP